MLSLISDKKRLISVFLLASVLYLAISIGIGFADTGGDAGEWICPACGTTGNGRNFCRKCGQPKPIADSSVSTNDKAEVTGFAWSRTIPVEQNRDYTESGWAIPDGGTEISSSREIHHYDQVLDHYENVEVQKSRQVLDRYETYYTYSDNGDGSFSETAHERPVYRTEYYTETERRPVYRSEPQYQTKYVYTIRRWTSAREATASGEDQNPSWPELNLKEDEREGSPRAERYSFTVTGAKGETETWYLAEEDWKKLSPGDRVTISTRYESGESWIVDEKGNQLVRVYSR